MTAAARDCLKIAIGGTAIEVISCDPAFLEMLHRQYEDFVAPNVTAAIRLDIELVDAIDTPDDSDDCNDDVQVRRAGGQWHISRGDFEARFDPVQRRGVVRQNANRHSIDSVIRIIHTLTLADEGGFLLHAASAIRNGRAFLFAGRSGAGKTTLSRLAPRDAYLLSDEVSYVRKSGGTFRAWGTPFTGELGTPGVNLSAPVEALCFLRQAPENELVPIEEGEALRFLMTNVLFFAADPGLAGRVFDTACELVASVKTFRLDFTPDDRVWDLIP